jgi:redox-sensitive bicupin YhaK (pirin superfamily)
MDPPRYQDIPPGEIPERTQDGARIRVIAGESGGVTGPVRGIVTAPLYLDVSVPARQRFEHPVPAGHSAMVYVFEGEGEVGLDASGKGRWVQHGAPRDTGRWRAAGGFGGENGMRFLVIAARPLGEPMAR